VKDYHDRNGEICVWESKHGWKIVISRRDKWGCHTNYVTLLDSMSWREAVDLAKRLRKEYGLK